MAKILRIDHIGVAVNNTEESGEKYKKILGAELVAIRTLPVQGNKTRAAYLKVGDGMIVLDGAADPNGFLARFIEKRGEGLHHIGLVVDDLDEFVGDLETKGVRIPHRESFGESRREILLSPNDLSGVLMKVIEWKDGDSPNFEERVQRLKKFLERQSKWQTAIQYTFGK